MKRKRFTKLMMSIGYSRNEANRIARNLPEEVTYASLYSARKWLRIFRKNKYGQLVEIVPKDTGQEVNT